MSIGSGSPDSLPQVCPDHAAGMSPDDSTGLPPDPELFIDSKGEHHMLIQEMSATWRAIFPCLALGIVNANAADLPHQNSVTWWNAVAIEALAPFEGTN